MRPLSWLAVLTAVFLSACGQKGALYLPESYLPEPTVTKPNPTKPNTTSSTPTAPNQTGVAP